MIRDFYDSKKECDANRYNNVQTNPRYRNFKQKHFTAGDIEQFLQYFQKENLKAFKEKPKNSVELWSKFQNLNDKSVLNTFNYIFNKFKKGLFIKIVDNQLKVFIPFSKDKFQNEWSDRIKFNKNHFRNLNHFISHSQELEGRVFKSRYVNQHIDEWYANNNIFRYEYPCQEGDSGIPMISNMFRELCKHRKIPDIEFFINKRDFPLFHKNSLEPYQNIYNNTPLVSHNYEKYSPLLSMVENKDFADIAIPTWADWDRVSNQEDGKFFPSKSRNYCFDFSTPWEEKTPVAVFRGASTGAYHKNPRILACLMSQKSDLIDAGITKWNCRPRMNIKISPYLQIINKHNLKLSNFLSPEEQSKYKYIINIPGHVCAYRLAFELSMGVVVFIVNSNYKLWFHKYLIPTDIKTGKLGHYIPINSDLSNLISVINWCKNNDEKAKQISINAKNFYKKYLTKNAILDFLQETLFNIKNQVGNYKYPPPPIYKQLKTQDKILTNMFLNYPKAILNDFQNNFQSFHHLYSINKALQWILQLKNIDNLISNIIKGKITEAMLFDRKICIKTAKNSHEPFIGIACINPITKIIPNFMYTYAYQNSKLYLEHIKGKSFLDFLLSEDFNIQDFLFILMQISLAVHVAQQEIAFHHLDLYPWNIILKYSKQPQTIHYRINNKKFIKIKTKIIPVIIDYGRSQAFYKGKMYGRSAPPLEGFKCSKFHDLLTLLVSSLSTLLRARYNTKRWLVIKRNQNLIIKLANFIANSKYTRYKTFYNLFQIRRFAKFAKNLSTLLQKPSDELDKKTPMEFFNYLQHLSKMDITYTKPYYNLIEHSKYIFNTCFNKEYNLFDKFNNATLPQSENLLEMYYAYESFKINLRLFYENNKSLEKEYEKSLSRLEDFYTPLLKTLSIPPFYKVECELPIEIIPPDIDYFTHMFQF